MWYYLMVLSYSVSAIILAKGILYQIYIGKLSLNLVLQYICFTICDLKKSRKTILENRNIPGINVMLIVAWPFCKSSWHPSVKYVIWQFIATCVLVLTILFKSCFYFLVYFNFNCMHNQSKIISCFTFSTISLKVWIKF